MSNGTNQGNPANRPAIKLVITLTPDGAVSVSGPINDQILSFGLLESAKQTVVEFNRRRTAEAAAEPRIEVATPEDLAANGIQLIDNLA